MMIPRVLPLVPGGSFRDGKKQREKRFRVQSKVDEIKKKLSFVSSTLARTTGEVACVRVSVCVWCVAATVWGVTTYTTARVQRWERIGRSTTSRRPLLPLLSVTRR